MITARDTLLACASALLIAFVLSASGRIDDHSKEASAADDAIRSEQAANKLMDAAKAMCGGGNTVAQLHDNGQWECFNKQGHRIAAKGSL